MRSAWFGAFFSAAFFTGLGAHAQEVSTNGVFDKWLNSNAPQCVPVAAFKSVSIVTNLSPAQFEFVRALYVALPPVSRTLPPGDHAVMAKAGDTVMLAIVSGAEACARFIAPDFIQAMLGEIHEGRVRQIGTPVSYVTPSND